MRRRAGLRVLVVDDEPPARHKLQRMLAGDGDVSEVLEASDGDEAVRVIRDRAPDILLLDIQMPGLNGFEVIEALGTGQLPAIIFVTAEGEHAVRAFEVPALDYLLKPFDEARLTQAMARAKAAIGHTGNLQTEIRELLSKVGGHSAFQERLLVREKERVFFVRARDVRWIESAGNYVRLHVDGATHLVRETLEAIGRQLDPTTFVRVHRSHLVNLDCVESLHPWSHGDYLIRLIDGTELRLSRRFKQQLPEALRRGL